MGANNVASINTAEYDELLGVLKEARAERKIGMIKLSTQLGYQRNYIERIEGRHRRVDLVEFCEIAKALGYEPLELITRFLDRAKF